MDAVNILSLISGSISIVIFLVGSFELWRNRNLPAVRATLPPINIMINMGYILNAISTTNQTVTHKEPCITYLWLTFIRIILMTTGYLLKALQIYVFSVVSDKLIEEMKNSTQETVKAIDEIQQDDNKEKEGTTVAKMDVEVPGQKSEEKKCVSSSIDQLIIERDYIGSKDFLVKCFFIIVGVTLIIPLLINCTQDQYYHPTDSCGDRTAADIVGLALLIVAFIIAFLFILYKLRSTKDAYGIKYQMFGMTIAWIVILVFTLLAFIIENEGVDAVWAVFSPASVLLPFAFGTGIPLYKVYTAKGYGSTTSGSTSLQTSQRDFSGNGSKEDTSTGNEKPDTKKRAHRAVGELKMNFHKLIQYTNNDRKAIGFDSIYSFCIQMDIAAGHNDYFFRNALLFVREYSLQQKSLEAETGERQTKQYANAFLLYQKYLADGKGELDHGRTALSTVLVDEDQLRLLQQGLGKAMATDDYSTTQPLETLQAIYDATMKETIAYLYKNYVLSNYFEAFMKEFHAEQRLNTLATAV